MLMIPHKRNISTIIIDKCIFHNSTTIRATHISSGSPTTKIIVIFINYHFDFFLLTYRI